MTSFNRYLKWLVYAVFFSLVAIIHSSFISALPPFFSAINLSLILLFFVLLFIDLNTALITSVLLGFWLDIFSFSFFGLNSVALFISVAAVNFLLINWLTNRSLYSFLALSVIGTVVYNFLFYLLLFFWQGGITGNTFFLFSASFWISLLRQIMWSAIFMIVFFNLANSLSKSLKPFFLEKK
jgi:cell shape-determining protein MreD